MLVALLVVSGALGAGGLAFRRHVTEGREFCVSCHTDVREHISAPAHQEMSCAACHDATFWPNAKQYFAGNGKHVPHGAADPGSCVECHAGREEDRELLAKLGGHETHVLRRHLPCADCHGGEAHIESFRGDSCTGCHDDVQTFQTSVGNLKCTACHAYSLRRPSKGEHPLDAPACAGCHHGPEVLAAYEEAEPTVTPEMVHGALGTCGLCHNPHEPSPSARLVVSDCSTCHASVAKKLAKAPEVAKHGDCSTCHQPHGERSELRSLCESCHTENAPEKMPAALASRHAACADCHADHQFLADRDDCARCHQAQNKELLSWDSGEHIDCLNCHVPHSEQEMDANCAECHRRNTAHRHEACTTCHAPHFGADRVKLCTDCHAPQVKQIAASSAAGDHQRCADCHTTHSPATTPARCANCHGEKVRLTATAPDEKHQQCVSCHQPHGFQTTTKVCSSCHQKSQLGHHSKDCQNCHNPHGPPGRGPANCVQCHDKINRGDGAHSECSSCHSVHLAEKGPHCADCHQGHQASAASWPNPEHRSCENCHVKHDAAAPKSCSSCHGTQAKQFGGSSHQCTTCHNPHQGPQQWWSGCRGCHQPQVAMTASRAPEHANCANCHQPHAPRQIKSCTTCHGGLGGAHQFKDHRQCSQCHGDPHNGRRPTREACLGCHDEMQDHHPEAKNCAACHPFK